MKLKKLTRLIVVTKLKNEKRRHSLGAHLFGLYHEKEPIELTDGCFYIEKSKLNAEQLGAELESFLKAGELLLISPLVGMPYCDEATSVILGLPKG